MYNLSMDLKYDIDLFRGFKEHMCLFKCNKCITQIRSILLSRVIAWDFKCSFM